MLAILIYVVGGLLCLGIIASLGMLVILAGVVIALGILIFQLPQPYSYIVFCMYVFFVLFLLYTAITKER